MNTKSKLIEDKKALFPKRENKNMRPSPRTIKASKGLTFNAVDDPSRDLAHYVKVEIAFLKNRLKRQESEIKEIKSLLDNLGLLPTPAPLKNPPKEDKHKYDIIKTTILEMLKTKKTIDYLDVIEQTKVKDIDLVASAFRELEQEGAINVASASR